MLFFTIVFSLGFSALVLVALSIFVCKNYNTPTAAPYSLTMLAVAGWIAFFGLDMYSADLSDKVLFQQFRFPFVAFATVFWYWCVLRFTQGNEREYVNPSPWLYVIPIATTFISLTMTYHNWFRFDFSTEIVGNFHLLRFKSGYWYLVHILFQYAITLATLWRLLAFAWRSQNPFFVRRTGLLFGFTIIPLFLDFLFNIGITPVAGYSLAPQSFLLIGLGHWYVLFKYRIVDLIPIARQEILANLSEGVLVFDQQNRLIDMNASGGQIFDLSSRAATGKTAKELLSSHPEVLALIESKSPANLDFETCMGESERCWEANFQLIGSDQFSCSAGYAIVIRDVTNRRKAEKNLIESENRHRSLLESAPFPAFIVDHENHVIAYANPQGLKWGGFLTEDIIGKPAVDFYTNPADRSKTMQILLNEGSINGIEVSLKKANGQSAQVLMSVRNITYLDKRSAFIAFMDITDMREAEKNLAAINLRNQELIVAEEEKQRIGRDLHDSVGQILTGTAMLFAKIHEQLRQGTIPGEQRLNQISEYLRTAIHETRNLSHGLSPLELHNDGLWNALEALADDIRNNHEIEVFLRTDHAVKISKRETALQLWRITQEAVQNCLKHARAHKIWVTLGLENSLGMLEISDDGEGFLGGTNTRTSSGKGFAIMHFRAGLLGGNMLISSQQGKGTIVRCSFPVKDQEVFTQ